MPGVDTEIVVVGAGVNGLSTAYELARRGRDVVVLEQFDVGHARGSSHGASRVFRLSYPDAQWVRHALRALTGWRRWESELGVTLLRRTGSIDVGAHVPRNRRALEQCGVDTETLSSDEARGRFGLVLAEEEDALLQGDAGVVSAARTLERLAEAGRAAGMTLREHAPVEQVAVDREGTRLITPSGAVTARAVVVTAGPWVTSLLEPLALAPKVRVTRETVAYLGLERAGELPVMLFADGPPESGHDVGTYTLADASDVLKVGVHHTGPAADPDGDDAQPDRGVADWALRFAHERLPGRPAALAGAEACFYTSTHDDEFVLERHGRVVVGSACSGHAFKFAPLTGETLARLAVEAADEQ